MHDARQKYFDELAHTWDQEADAEKQGQLEVLIDSLHIAEGHQVLDLGCGTGVLFPYLLRQLGSDGHLIGIDFSARMVEEARKRFNSPQLHVLVADVSCIPLGEASCDVAIAYQSFPHFSDKEAAVEEIHRILKPGGSFHVIHLMSSEQLSAHHRYHGDVISDDKLLSGDEMYRLLADRGYVDISIQDQPGLYVVSATRSKW